MKTTMSVAFIGEWDENEDWWSDVLDQMKNIKLVHWGDDVSLVFAHVVNPKEVPYFPEMMKSRARLVKLAQNIVIGQNKDLVIVVNNGQMWDTAWRKAINVITNHEAVMLIWTPEDVNDDEPPLADQYSQPWLVNVKGTAAQVAAVAMTILLPAIHHLKEQ